MKNIESITIMQIYENYKKHEKYHQMQKNRKCKIMEM